MFSSLPIEISPLSYVILFSPLDLKVASFAPFSPGITLFNTCDIAFRTIINFTKPQILMEMDQTPDKAEQMRKLAKNAGPSILPLIWPVHQFETDGHDSQASSEALGPSHQLSQ